MEEAFLDVPLHRECARLDAHGQMPDESTILRFRHRLEKHKLADPLLATVNALLSSQGLLLKEGSAVDAMLIAEPSSTKKQKVQARPRDAFEQEGQPIALWDEGAHRRGCRLTLGAHSTRHSRPCGRCHRKQ